MLCEKIICAGFGGQGLMSLGQILAYAGMLEGRQVTWLPSYGPEMRGGTANCHVIISDKPVGSPLITNDATTVIAMNLPSLLRFEPKLVVGGVLLVNSSMVAKRAERGDLRDFYLPANEEARGCGSPKMANMIMLGAYLEIAGAVSTESVVTAFSRVFGDKDETMLAQNLKALNRGAGLMDRAAFSAAA